MKNSILRYLVILLLLIGVFISTFSYGQKQSNPVDGLKKEVKFLAKKIDVIQKIAEKYGRKYNSSVSSYKGFKGIHIIELAWTSNNGNFHAHRWYFSNGPFCDGYSYITNSTDHYTLLKKSFEFSADEYYGDGNIKLSSNKSNYNVMDISTTKTYYSTENKLYVSFGAKNVNDGLNQYKIEIYRNNF